MLALGLGAMVVQLDGSIVAIANPVIAADLGAGLEGISWVTTAYLLVVAGLLIPAGALADRIGHKKALLTGIGGFSLASLLCGLSGSIEMLIAARVLQGVFAAVIAPAGLAVLRAAFPPEKLSMAFGIFGSISAVSTAGGPILGGVLVQYASWPWAFYVNLPVGVLAVVVGSLVISETAERGSRRLDLWGALVLTLAMLSVVWAVNGVPAHGWASVNTLGFLGAGIVLLGVFVAVERRVRNSMVPLGLFANRTFSLGAVLMVVIMFAFFAILFYLTFYLQGVRGNGPIATAVAMLPLTVVFAVSSPMAGWLTGRFGMRATMVLGSVCTAVSLLLLLRVDVGSSTLTLVPSLVLAGFGVGFLMMPAIQAVVAGVPVGRSGAASGIQQSAGQLGSTLGVAVLGSVLASVVTSGFGVAVRAASGGDAAVQRIITDPQTQQAVSLGFAPAAQQGLAQQLQHAGMPAEQVGELVRTVTAAAHHTFVDGLHVVFVIAAAVAVVAGLIALFIRRPEPQPDNGETPARV
ncbi:MFS transporter [Saccharopolyspora erythraea]|nr:MFS transporter [Saccharopolyspora erythraea]